MSFVLRDYQSECLDEIGTQFLRGYWSQVVVLPTGCGKTEIFARLRLGPLGPWLSSFPERQQKILVVAHRDELIEQAVRKFIKANPDLIVGVEKAEQRSSWMHDVIVGSIGSLKGKRLQQIDPDTVRVVIIDEAHHAPADSYQELLRYFNLLPPASMKPKASAKDLAPARQAYQQWWSQEAPQRLLLGVTATAARGDAIGLEWTFQRIAYERSLRWMIERGYLARLRGFVVDTKLSLDDVSMTAGDFNLQQLAQAVNTPERNRAAILGWIERCRELKTLGFTVDIQHAKDLAAMAAGYGFRAEYVFGEDPLRSEKVARFRASESQLLFNANMLTEGFDCPDIGCVLMAKPTMSQGLYMQMIGRGTRLAPGKADCIVLDVVDTSRKHSLLTVGDLFGLPARLDLRGEDALTALVEIEQIQESYPALPMPAGATLELIRRSIREIDLWAIVPSAAVEQWATMKWIEDNPSRYHIPMPSRNRESGAIDSAAQQTAIRGQRLISLDDDAPKTKPAPLGAIERCELQQDMLGGWSIVQMVGRERSLLARAEDLPAAFKAGERWIQMMRPDVAAMKSRSARWIGKMATEKQKALLTRLKASFNPETLTRGDASDMLDRWMARKR